MSNHQFFSLLDGILFLKVIDSIMVKERVILAEVVWSDASHACHGLLRFGNSFEIAPDLWSIPIVSLICMIIHPAISVGNKELSETTMGNIAHSTVKVLLFTTKQFSRSCETS